MEHGEILAKEKGFDRIRVDTSSVNMGMQRLFVDLGYEMKGGIPLEGHSGGFVCYEKIFS